MSVAGFYGAALAPGTPSRDNFKIKFTDFGGSTTIMGI